MARTKLNHQQKHAFSSIISGFAAASLLIILVSLIGFVLIRGASFFWPMTIYEVTTQDNSTGLSTEKYEISSLDLQDLQSNLNVRISAQFVDDTLALPFVSITQAKNVYQIALSNGAIKLGAFSSIHTPLGKTTDLQDYKPARDAVNTLIDELSQIQMQHLAIIHRTLADYDRSNVAQNAPARIKVMQEFDKWQRKTDALNMQLKQYYIVFTDAQTSTFRVYLRDLDRWFKPNEMGGLEKLGYMVDRFAQFLGDSPKQAATSGGVFPALFGTVLLVMLMAVIVAPLGIMAAIYLHEYAPNNMATSFIRISISNMAGVPSVVYGVFGLGFFVYVIGGSIDQLFYSDALPTPTCGTPGLVWAALTMALLTLPVVIVSTEEGLRRVPDGLRSGAYALGATKFEAIIKTVAPIASPGMITGLILAVARAAGEVAPLILVGAVKFAPSLPVDGEFPFVHLERQFMHLGVFIYDGAFHNQTNTQGSSMMFASCLLLLLIVFALNLFAIIVRNNLKKRYVRQ